MKTYTSESLENKNQVFSRDFTQKHNSGESTFQLLDNRPEAIAQRVLLKMANNSQRILQLRSFYEIANNNHQAKQLMPNNNTSQSLQRQEALEEETIQGKFGLIQLKSRTKDAKLLHGKFAPVQRKVYFTDEDGAQATEKKPKVYPHWESPLNGTNQTLHNSAQGAQAAAVAALNVGAFSKLLDEPTKYSGGGEPANGLYEFWHNEKSGQVVGHPTHTEDTTNTLTLITKAGKKEKRGNENAPVVHDHAADYGIIKEPYALLANPGVKYNKTDGAMDHYLQKPT